MRATTRRREIIGVKECEVVVIRRGGIETSTVGTRGDREGVRFIGRDMQRWGGGGGEGGEREKRVQWVQERKEKRYDLSVGIDKGEAEGEKRE